MPASKEFLELVLEKLAPLGAVTGRSMFGGFGVFHEGEMFGLISNDVLYLKADDSNREDYVKTRQPAIQTDALLGRSCRCLRGHRRTH
ncbi:TfoX N-terminal domain [Dehalogenimonas alkenigignens]|uniref:TfoX N-terminal domain n=1 Tax=Dehalogenimonas alkenigignens TaxID=1217799 RepID=A0A0W0GI13_9CHLR|nr:TfoX/Sxy family protein [Dehalogenimonas alkenigignens]KTB48198.1 TfoX N-terminal domain [Dehalogenimonas alkenigignens]